MQNIIEKKASPTFQRHNLGLMAHPNTIIAETDQEKKTCLFFLDDLAYGGNFNYSGIKANQPKLEFLRQV